MCLLACTDTRIYLHSRERTGARLKFLSRIEDMSHVKHRDYMTGNQQQWAVLLGHIHGAAVTLLELESFSDSDNSVSSDRHFCCKTALLIGMTVATAFTVRRALDRSQLFYLLSTVLRLNVSYLLYLSLYE